MDKIKKILSHGSGEEEQATRSAASDNRPLTGTSTTGDTSRTDPVQHEKGFTHNPVSTSRPTASAIPSHLSFGADDNASVVGIRSGVVGGDPAGPSNIGLGHSGNTTQSTSQSTSDMDPLSVHQHKGQGHNFDGDPCPPGDEPQVKGYPHHFSGPHSTDTANRLDPHVPGEFPSESGYDVHDTSANHASSMNRGFNDATGPNAGSALNPGIGSADLPGTSSADVQHQSSIRDGPLAGTAGFEEQRFDPTATSSHKPLSEANTHFPSLSSHPPGTAITTDQPHNSHSAALGTAAAGAAGIGAYETSSGHRSGPTETDPATKTAGPHKSNIANIVDPRVKPEPEKMKSHSTSVPYQSDTLNRAEPREDAEADKSTHHYGRDAAVAGGVGAAGVGAYEAGQPIASRQEDPASFTVGPHTSNVANILDPRVKPQPEKMKGSSTAGTYQSSTPYDQTTLPEQSTGHHYGRDAAIAGGVGAAGAGAGAYGATHQAGSREEDPASFTTGPHQSNIANIVDPRVKPQPEKMKEHSTPGTHQSDTLNRADPRTGVQSEQTKDHHYGRDAAVAGGAGAAGLAGYEATKQNHLAAPQSGQQPLATPTGAPEESRIFDQTQKVPEKHQVGGGWAADQKAQEKLEKERAKEAEKAHDKAIKEDKRHPKEAEKAHDKAHEKAAKEERRNSKSADKDEKKHGLLGFLHRDKKDTPEEKAMKEQGNLREADQAAHLRHQRELEEAANAGTIDKAGASFEPTLGEQQVHPDPSSPQRVSVDGKGHHKLHKEPPAKVQRELDERAREESGLSAASTNAATTSTGGNGQSTF
ncbi:hypothetical protein AAFC00_000123 [Neodothiora populina]|uniref:Dehydrin n=1 Tax=Neodothiora populina TaxID=2781224 RepID=A0ABR3P1G4_9PEZI